MPGMQFEYDEEGGTFYYFLLSFWGLVLIPATYYLWPRAKAKDDAQQSRIQCSCEQCQLKKTLLKTKDSWFHAKDKSIKIGLIIGWLIFFLLAYKVSKIQMDYVEYDPFQELEVDRGASPSEIKKAYRKLSLIYHPDKQTGDPKKFMRIAKAFAALTDEESRKNWEEYGNPDGPGATRFGIALPKWIVERENSMWVLAAYLLVFMILMPIIVGMWWYRSIKFSGDQILLDTTHLYFYFISRTPNMILKRAIMILGASFEFDRFHNAEIANRPSDNEEIPTLMKLLPNIQKENKKPPLCYPYSIKARALILAHCQRMPLPPLSLDIDKQYILNKCPYLLNEMINICAQQVAMAMAGRLQQSPRLDTVENLMKLSQMIIQALEEKSSSLLQLPHITQDMLRHFVGKKRNIRTIRDLVSMKEEDRRSMLRGLNDSEYNDVMNVCAGMPDVIMEVTSEVLDDEDKSITAGSIVTVTVRLTREDLGLKLNRELPASEGVEDVVENDGDEEGEDGEEKQTNASPQNKPKVWEKQKKKGKKGGAKQKKKTKQANQWKSAAPHAKSDAAQNNGKTAKAAEAAAEGADDDEHEDVPEKKPQDSHVEESEDEERNESEEEQEETKKPVKSEDEEKDEDEEEDWSKFQEESRKENSLETKSKESHIVHCPYFPTEKQEWWWLYVADRKHHNLITAPVQICSLKKDEEVQLKFSAPRKPGSYQYSVILRSDSYLLDFDKISNIKLDVKEAKVVSDHPQWDISDDEAEKEDGAGEDTEEDSDYSSEEDDDD
ncbi:translocation protein SEC63 homolog [Haliotis asinina]|uniref:translocation protein SEC63 homolog n=1 Tax=Haliotis asinina TaxID=109174 RepID=UPI003532330D